MKKLRPNFCGLKGMVSSGFLTLVAVIFLFASASASHAQGAPSPPKWVPFELKAINLYELGINQESSDMASALKTLQQARQDSTDAIVNGGGSNPAVLHNDYIIGRALMMARMHATTTRENKPATQTQKTGSSHPVKPVVHYAKTSIRIR